MRLGQAPTGRGLGLDAVDDLAAGDGRTLVAGAGDFRLVGFALFFGLGVAAAGIVVVSSPPPHAATNSMRTSMGASQRNQERRREVTC